MAFRHGKFAAITVNSKDLAAFCSDVSLSIDVDTADTSTFGSTWKTSLAGLVGGKTEVKGLYDPTATTGPAAVFEGCITGGVAVPVLHYPGGNVAGQRLNTFNAIVIGYSESSPVGGIVAFTASLLVTGAVTPTVI